MSWHVTLDELDRDGTVRSLPDDVAGVLEGTELVEVRPQGAGQWRLVPRGRVGAVRIGDLQVQVNPKEKVGLSKLLFMLGYAADPGFRPQYVEGIENPELWPALAESLARLTDRALERGVLQGYQAMEDSLRTVRGRIRIGDQIRRHPGQLMPLEVTYDEYTVDTAENRILRSALRRMAAVPRLSSDHITRLRHLDARLEGVSRLNPGQRLPRWTPTRLNIQYQPALRLAEVVLRHASTEAGAGGHTMASFVVPMWKVFEDFVVTALGEVMAPLPGRVTDQFTDWLDEPRHDRQRRTAIEIDLVHCDAAGRPRIIFDAKYKVAGPRDQYPNADLYQMLAYCTALEVPVAWLIYAQGGAERTERRIRNTDITVVEYPLNLSATPGELLEQVRELAARAHQYGAINRRAVRPVSA